MKFFIIAIGVSIGIMNAGCDTTSSKNVIGNYYIIDFESETSLSYRLENGNFIGVVSGEIQECFVVSDSFIIVKRSPVVILGQEFDSTEYYQVIRMTDQFKLENGVKLIDSLSYAVFSKNKDTDYQ